jgi:hypothetical protein
VLLGPTGAAPGAVGRPPAPLHPPPPRAQVAGQGSRAQLPVPARPPAGQGLLYPPALPSSRHPRNPPSHPPPGNPNGSLRAPSRLGDPSTPAAAPHARPPALPGSPSSPPPTPNFLGGKSLQGAAPLSRLPYPAAGLRLFPLHPPLPPLPGSLLRLPTWPHTPGPPAPPVPPTPSAL